MKEIRDLSEFERKIQRFPKYTTLKLSEGDTFRGHLLFITESKFKNPATGEPRLQIEIREPASLERVFIPLNKTREEFVKELVARGLLVPVPRDENTPAWIKKQFMAKQPEHSIVIKKIARIYIIAYEKLTPKGAVYLVPESRKGSPK